jgi:N-acetylglucosaminyldiphosphoundecaprenol N-acetyl-beta-D-mannosaminyltransferase
MSESVTEDIVEIFGVPVNNLTLAETLRMVNETIASSKQIHHSVINAGKVVAMDSNPELRKSVCEADIINADGQGIVWAAKHLGTPIKERVTGIDLMNALIAGARVKGHKIYFFGAKQEVVDRVVEVVTEQHSTDIIAGYRNGYFSDDEESQIAGMIAESGANILFVAMTSPKKEIFLAQHKEVLSKVNFVMGVGGSFDVLAGKVKRAPLWMQKIGLEWFYRFIQEPRRLWGRYVTGNIKFLRLVINEKSAKQKS